MVYALIVWLSKDESSSVPYLKRDHIFFENTQPPRHLIIIPNNVCENFVKLLHTTTSSLLAAVVAVSLTSVFYVNIRQSLQLAAAQFTTTYNVYFFNIFSLYYLSTFDYALSIIILVDTSMILIFLYKYYGVKRSNHMQ